MDAALVDPAALTELAEQLRAVLAEVESGDLAAETDQVAFLRGVLATAEVLAR